MNAIRNPLKLARRLAHAAPPVLARYYTPDCCIAATRVAIDVLGRFGVHASAVPVTALVWNPAYKARVERGGQARDADELMRFYEVDGSWTVGVGIGTPDVPGKYNGHLVCGLRGGAGSGLVLDLTASQADRPAKGITLGPLVFTPPPAFWDGGGDYVWVEENGCAVGYRRNTAPGAGSFVDGPDWRDPMKTAAAARDLYRAIR